MHKSESVFISKNLPIKTSHFFINITLSFDDDDDDYVCENFVKVKSLLVAASKYS